MSSIRFDAIDMLERLRGKRVILVGDSLNRNQWESLACLLYSAIPSSRAHVDFREGSYKVFKAKVSQPKHEGSFIGVYVAVLNLSCSSIYRIIIHLWNSTGAHFWCNYTQTKKVALEF